MSIGTFITEDYTVEIAGTEVFAMEKEDDSQ
jgi:hypothetical protein